MRSFFHSFRLNRVRSFFVVESSSFGPLKAIERIRWIEFEGFNLKVPKYKPEYYDYNCYVVFIVDCGFYACFLGY